MACSQACADSCGQVCDNECSLECSSNCKYGCSKTCSGSCKSGCSEGCGAGCSGGCTGCTGDCSNSSVNDCGGYCQGCTNACEGQCTYFVCTLGCASCVNECGGCSLGCGSDCAGSCVGDCENTCNYGCIGQATDTLFENLSLEKYLKANNINDIVAFVNHEIFRRGKSIDALKDKKVSDFEDQQALATLAQNLLQGLTLIYGDEAISSLFKYAQTNESIEELLGNIIIKFAKQAYHEIV